MRARAPYDPEMNQRSSRAFLVAVFAAVLLAAMGVAGLALFSSGWGMQFT